MTPPSRPVCCAPMQNYKPSIFVKQIPVGPMMNFAYLVGAANGNKAVLIDPSWDAKKLLNSAEEESRDIEALLTTHTHFDHINVIEDIAKITKASVYVHQEEAKELPRSLNLHITEEGMLIEVAGIKITCLHTPGHTPGSQCFLIENTLFTGDTLFVDGCGRVDLAGGDPEAMANSLRRLSELPQHIIVYPGHDYGGSQISTIGEQRQRNPYMRAEPSALL